MHRSRRHVGDPERREVRQPAVGAHRAELPGLGDDLLVRAGVLERLEHGDVDRLGARRTGWSCLRRSPSVAGISVRLVGRSRGCRPSPAPASRARPARTSCATPVGRHVVVVEHGREALFHPPPRVAAEDVRQLDRPAARPDPVRAASPAAREQAAVIASSSAPISTSRPSTACRFSSFGPNRIMQWKSVRASRRQARSTNRTWVASRPNSP